MAKYIITNDGLHRVSDELCHWKYIYKKKVNGKWRYYYGEPTLKDRVKGKLGYAERDYADAAKRDYKTAGSLAATYRKQLNGRMSPRKREDARANYEAATVLKNINRDGYKQALSDYRKTPLHKVRTLRKKAVEKGKSFVDSASSAAKRVGGKARHYARRGANFVKTAVSAERRKAKQKKEYEKTLNAVLKKHKKEHYEKKAFKGTDPGNYNREYRYNRRNNQRRRSN